MENTLRRLERTLIFKILIHITSQSKKNVRNILVQGNFKLTMENRVWVSNILVFLTILYNNIFIIH